MPLRPRREPSDLVKLLHPLRVALVLLVIPLSLIPFLAACASALEAPGPDPAVSEAPETTRPVPTPGETAAAAETPGPDPTESEAPQTTHPAPTPAQTTAVPEAVTEITPHPPATEGPIKHEIMPTRSHVAEGVPVTYNSIPPTSGNHWPQWSRCGFFPLRIPDERLVHNLEHGNIVVSFNLATSEEVDRLRKALEEIDISADWGISRSYDQIPIGTVALAAWGFSDTMPGVIPERIRSFFEAFAGEQGPERIPCSGSGVVPPGMGRAS